MKLFRDIKKWFNNQEHLFYLFPGHSDSAQCSAMLYRTHIMDGKDM